MADKEINDLTDGGAAVAGDLVHVVRSGNSRKVALKAQLPTVPASSSGPASMEFAEDTDNGSHKVTVTAPASLTADRTVTWPDKSGTPAMTDDLGMSTTERRNALLRLATLAKLSLGYQRDIGCFAAGFKGASDAADGIYVAGSSGYTRDSSAGCVKPNAGGIDSFAKVVLHFDGSDGATSTTDSSASPKTVAFVNQAQLDTAQTKFGTASLLMDGTDDYIYMEDSADFAMGTGDFTFDFWLKRASVSSAQENTFGQGNSGLTGGYQNGYITTGNTFRFGMNDDTYQANGPASALNNTSWNHIAVVRSGNNLAVAVNGSWGSNVDVTGQTYTDTATRFAIGQLGEFTGGSSFNGWLDEFRISKGVARWTPGVSFTPPTVAYVTGFYDSTVQFLQQTVESTGYVFAVAEVQESEAMTIGTTYVAEVFTGGTWQAMTVVNAGLGEAGRTVVGAYKGGMTPGTTVDIRIRTVGKDHRTYRFGYDARNAA